MIYFMGTMYIPVRHKEEKKKKKKSKEKSKGKGEPSRLKSTFKKREEATEETTENKTENESEVLISDCCSISTHSIESEPRQTIIHNPAVLRICETNLLMLKSVKEEMANKAQIIHKGEVKRVRNWKDLFNSRGQLLMPITSAVHPWRAIIEKWEDLTYYRIYERANGRNADEQLMTDTGYSEQLGPQEGAVRDDEENKDTNVSKMDTPSTINNEHEDGKKEGKRKELPVASTQQSDVFIIQKS